MNEKNAPRERRRPRPRPGANGSAARPTEPGLRGRGDRGGAEVRPYPSPGSAGPETGGRRVREPRPPGRGAGWCPAARARSRRPFRPRPTILGSGGPCARWVPWFVAQGLGSSGRCPELGPVPLPRLRGSGPSPCAPLVLRLARASSCGYLFFLPSDCRFSLPPPARCSMPSVLCTFYKWSLTVLDDILSPGVCSWGGVKLLSWPNETAEMTNKKVTKVIRRSRENQIHVTLPFLSSWINFLVIAIGSGIILGVDLHPFIPVCACLLSDLSGGHHTEIHLTLVKDCIPLELYIQEAHD
ncbi:uncharacterized protein LOC129671447 [Psammomys obesus]|uniref:uncharacterized protein LOC129671447 n=1 Tax=Psammomys obesus TaxID=48139 RepID=UPI0024536F25|nr:uncharacterized protein LOC129671447 [Psammomys obesus]